MTTSAALAAAVTISSPAFAQQSTAAQAPSDESGDEIIVTARRTEERLQDVPVSITVFNQQQLTARNVVSALDLSTYTPSLSANSRFGNESTTFAIRGFTQDGATFPSVAVYFADVVAPRANGGTSAGNGAGVGAFFDLQNVQVLKGPQGTLFGRNTTGGAVLLVPRKPSDKLEGYAELSAGNYNMIRGQAAFNIPLASTVRLRIAADRQIRDGYLRNRSGIGPKDFNDVDYVALRGSLVVDVTPEIENYTILSYSSSHTHGFYPKVVICNPAAPLLGPLSCAQIARQEARGDGFYDIENGNPFADQHIKQTQLINTTTWRASDTLTLKNIISYARFKQDQTANIFGDNFFLAPGFPFTFVGLYPDAGRHNASQWTFTEELQLQGKLANESLNWQAGVYFEKSGPLGGYQGTLSPILLSCTDVYALRCVNPIGAGNIQQSLQKYYFRNLGVYAQGTYRFSDRLSLTAGARYTSDETSGIGAVRRISFPAPNTPVFTCVAFPGRPAPTPDDCRYPLTQKSSRPTWMIDLEYKPTRYVMLYAKYSRGYRQGGVAVSNPGLLETWGPEKVDTYEVGAKTSFRGRVHGYLNVAAFYNDFRDQQLQANAQVIPPQSPVSGIINAGKSRIYGAEVDASISPLENLTLDVSYAYLNTKLQEFVTPPLDPTRFVRLIPTSVVGGPLALAPKNKISATATYRLPMSESVGRISLGATFTHTDKQVASAASPIGVLPATNLLNLNLNWESIGHSPLDLALFATNVTRKKYATYVGGSYASSGFDTIIVGQPRMYGARLRFRFGN
jgi:iron complex outermembrane receptor protein